MSQISSITSASFIEQRIKGNTTIFTSNTTTIDNTGNTLFDFDYDVAMSNFTQLPDRSVTNITLDGQSGVASNGLIYSGTFFPIINLDEQVLLNISGNDITSADAEVIKNFIQVGANVTQDTVTVMQVTVNVQQLQAYNYPQFTITIPVEEANYSVPVGGISFPMLRITYANPSNVVAPVQVRVANDSSSLSISTQVLGVLQNAFQVKMTNDTAYTGKFTNVAFSITKNINNPDYTISLTATENLNAKYLADIYISSNFLFLPTPNEDTRTPKPQFNLAFTNDFYRHGTGSASPLHVDSTNTIRLNYNIRGGFGTYVGNGIINSANILRLGMNDYASLSINPSTKQITVNIPYGPIPYNYLNRDTRRIPITLENVRAFAEGDSIQGFFRLSINATSTRLTRINYRSEYGQPPIIYGQPVEYTIDPEGYVFDFFSVDSPLRYFDLRPDINGNNKVESGTPDAASYVGDINYLGDYGFNTAVPASTGQPYDAITTDHRYRWAKWKHVKHIRNEIGGTNPTLGLCGATENSIQIFTNTAYTNSVEVNETAPTLSYNYDGKTLYEFVEWFKDNYAGYGIMIDWGPGIQARYKSQVTASSAGNGYAWKNLPINGTIINPSSSTVKTINLAVPVAGSQIYIRRSKGTGTNGVGGFFDSGAEIGTEPYGYINISSSSSIQNQLSTPNASIYVEDVSTASYDTLDEFFTYIVDRLNSVIVTSTQGVSLGYTATGTANGQPRFVYSSVSLPTRYASLPVNKIATAISTTNPLIVTGTSTSYDGKTFYSFSESGIEWRVSAKAFFGSGTNIWSKSLSIPANTTISTVITTINNDNIMSSVSPILSAQALTTVNSELQRAMSQISLIDLSWPRTNNSTPALGEVLVTVKTSVPQNYNKIINLVNNNQPLSLAAAANKINNDSQQNIIQASVLAIDANTYPNLNVSNLQSGQLIPDMRIDNDSNNSTAPFYDLIGTTYTVGRPIDLPRYDIEINYNIDFVGSGDCIIQGVDAGVQVAYGGYSVDGVFTRYDAPNTYYEVGWNVFTPNTFTVSNADIVYLLVRTRATTNRGETNETSVFTANASTYRATISYSDGTRESFERLYTPTETQELDAWTEDFGVPAVIAVPITGEITSIDVQDVCYLEAANVTVRYTSTEIDEFGFLAINNTNSAFNQQESQIGTSFGLVLDTIGSWDILLTPESKLINSDAGNISYGSKNYVRQIFDIDQGYDVEIINLPSRFSDFVTITTLAGRPQIQVISISPGLKDALGNIRNARRDQESLEGCSVTLDLRVTGRRIETVGECSITIYYDVNCIYDQNLCEYYWNLKELPKVTKAQVLQNTINITYTNLIDCQTLIGNNDNLLAIKVPTLIKLIGIPTLENGTGLLLMKSTYNSILKRFYYPVGSELDSIQLPNCDDITNNIPLSQRLNRPYLLLPTSNTPIVDPDEIATKLLSENSYMFVNPKFRTPNSDVIKDCSENEIVVLGVGFEYKNWRYELHEHNSIIGFEYEFPEDIYTPPNLNICYRYYYNIYKT